MHVLSVKNVKLRLSLANWMKSIGKMILNAKQKVCDPSNLAVYLRNVYNFNLQELSCSKT